MPGTAPGGPPPVGAPLLDRFREVARRAPGTVAVVAEDGTAWTYAELSAAVDDASRRLAGVTAPRGVLGIAVEDHVAFVSLYLAAAGLDLVTVLLDGRLPEAELAAYVARLDVGVLAVDEPGGPGEVALRTVPGGRLAHEYAPEDFVVHCTSGSTGEPKGIVMSQAAIDARVSLWSGALGLGPDDVVLCALPLAHCHGIDVLTLPALLSGATVVFARGARLTARGLERRIAAHGVTVVSGLPLMYQLLTGRSGGDGGALRSLRLAISGSAPLRVETQRAFEERYGLPLRQVYGLSEIGVICFDADHVGRGSIGTPVTGIEWRLEPADAPASVEVATGAAGAGAGEGPALRELWVRGPALARGYYRDPVATAEMFVDGWLRTRDLLEVDGGGWFVRGRLSTFINVAGAKVGPLEVESVLRSCAGVVDGAVVGLPDVASTERVAAAIEVGPAFDADALTRELGDRLLPHQLPQQVEVVAALPRTPLGKVDYAAVRRHLETAVTS